MSDQGFGGEPRPVDGQHKAETNWRLIAGGLIALLLVIFILINRDEVDVEFAVATVTMSLWLIIAITTLLGLAVGWLLASRRARRKSRD